jgi:hypothetical protein
MKTLLTLILLTVLGAIIFIHIYLGDLVRDRLQAELPKALKTEVSIGSVSIDLFSGGFSIEDFVIANPKGFTKNNAIKIDELEVEIDLSSIFSDMLVIKKIEIEDPAFRFEGTMGNSNFHTLHANALTYGPVKDKKTTADSGKKQKIVINDLYIEDAEFTTGVSFAGRGRALSATMPEIHMKDIGKKQGGMELYAVVAYVTQSLVTMARQVDLSTLPGVIGQGAEGAAGLVADTVGGAAGLVGDGVKGTADTLNSLIGN